MPEELPENGEQIVLLVEDRAASAAALEMVLSGIDSVRVRISPNGAAAWDFLQGIEGGKVCAVVTDLDMPLISGMDLIRRIRASGAHAKTPVIVVSGTTDAAAPQEAMQAGANAFFSKPWSPGRVRATLEQLLHGRDAERQ
ncbi:MAG TPA: response regulator [Bryobacteraceae bacterium]|nr:response regulator [Bryobacteraceae bacterium]